MGFVWLVLSCALPCGRMGELEVFFASAPGLVSRLSPHKAARKGPPDGHLARGASRLFVALLPTFFSKLLTQNMKTCG